MDGVTIGYGRSIVCNKRKINIVQFLVFLRLFFCRNFCIANDADGVFNRIFTGRVPYIIVYVAVGSMVLRSCY